MLRIRTPTYTCWRCLLKETPSAAVGFFRLASTTRSMQHGRKSAKERLLGVIKSSKNQRLSAAVRDRLRKWEQDSAALEGGQAVAAPITQRTPAVSMLAPSTGDAVTAESEIDTIEHYSLYHGDEAVDMRTETVGFGVGDLVELSTDTWRNRHMAVCLGLFNNLYHFYTDHGKWFASYGVNTHFVVKKFVQDPVSISDIVESLPATDVSQQEVDVLLDLKVGPSRVAGASLMQQILAFQQEAHEVQLDYLGQIKSAIAQLTAEEAIVDLKEAAKLVFGEAPARGYKPEALYAVHTALSMADLGFEYLSGSQQQDLLLAVTSVKDIQTIEEVQEMVRAFHDNTRIADEVMSPRQLQKTTVGQFILRARSAIDNSRRWRDVSRHGLLGLSRQEPRAWTVGWTDVDRQIIKFLYLWVGSTKIKPSSSYHWVGSSLLRATARYGDVEYITTSTGWTFLQELGVVAPWDPPSRHLKRLPGARSDELVALQLMGLKGRGDTKPEETTDLNFADRQKKRLEWNPDDSVFCVDSADTLDVDDGISLEDTDRPDEWWIHVHVADPASGVLPNTPLAKQAAARAQASYLAGYHENMFGSAALRKNFSLAPGARALTFSARVDEQGRTLETKIQPTRLTKVVYMENRELAKVCSDHKPRPSPALSFSVGTPPPEEGNVASRKLTAASELDRESVRQLRTLSRLAKALDETRLAKGAIPVYPARAEAKVSLANTRAIETGDGFHLHEGDPYIHISYSMTSGHDFIASIMQLAGQVAASWCAARGIPVPYRINPAASRNLEGLHKLTRTTIYPALLAGKEPLPADLRRMRLLLGGHDISTTPQSNYSMGIDMYTKATSPLRRYSDLLVHWQIHAALLEEEDRNSSLVGNTDDTFLPFSRKQLDTHVLPELRVRERYAKLMSNVEGNTHWMLQALVRAWKFGDRTSCPLPEKFRFMVHKALKRRLAGRLDWFDRPATLDAEGLEGVALVADVQEGDVFEVELVDVNVYERDVMVRAVRRCERGEPWKV